MKIFEDMYSWRRLFQAVGIVAIANSIIVILLVTGLTKEKVDHEKALEIVFGGEENIDIVANAERVEVSKLDPMLRRFLKKEEMEDLEIESFMGYPIIQGPKNADALISKILKEDLSDPFHYNHGFSIACSFLPGYLLRFYKGTDTIEILISFSRCPEVLISKNGQRFDLTKVKMGSGLNERYIYPGFVYFDMQPVKIHHALENMFRLYDEHEGKAIEARRGIRIY